jgi:molybdate transport system regulatory protein
MKVAFKIWLDNNGKAFGEGPYRLLKGVEKAGSLHQAAMDLGMSYRKAWLTIHAVEAKLGFLLLDRKIGGTSGGGSMLTDEGKAFIGRYEGFRADAEKSLDEIYEKHFGK